MKRCSYILVTDGVGCRGSTVSFGGESLEQAPFDCFSSQGQHLYTESTILQCLQCMGCKPKRSQKVCRKVFWIFEQRLMTQCVPSDEQGSATGAIVHRHDFEHVILSCLGEHPRNLTDDIKLLNIQLAMQLHERRLGLVVLLCGTTGTGKSTLASLVASRLGITSVVSTDVIRHMLRGFDPEKKRDCLWSSTYDGGKGAGSSRVLDGYREQRGAILEHAEKLVDSFVARNESIVIEGVHLSGEFAITMMKRHASVVPFLVHISNRDKHMERFAVRAKSMTLRPDSNRYVKHLESIRSIQEALRGEAGKYLIPQVDNTNVDRSLAVIHSTVLGALRLRVSHGKALTNGDTCMPVLDIFNAAIKSSWSSRAILRKIQGDKSTFDLSGPSPATSVTSTTLGTGALSGLSDHVLKDAFQNLRVDEYESGSQGSAPDHHDGSVLETLSEHTKSDDGHAL